MDNFRTFNDSELINLYGRIVKELQNRKIIRTKNVIGDLGERFAIDYYTRSKNLESLSHAPPSNKRNPNQSQFKNEPFTLNLLNL